MFKLQLLQLLASCDPYFLMIKHVDINTYLKGLWE